MTKEQIENRRIHFELVQKLVTHMKKCAMCDQEKEVPAWERKCTDFKRLNKLIGDNAELADPAWFKWVHDFLPTVLPAHWSMVQKAVDGAAYVKNAINNVRVIVGGDWEEDGSRWLHVSVSKDRGIPDWYDMTEVKHIFIGPSRVAYQVMPSENKYVNLAEVLHMWSPFDKPQGVLPDFTGGGISI